MIGYDHPDWGMGGYYLQEDVAQKAEIEVIRRRQYLSSLKSDCLEIAERTAVAFAFVESIGFYKKYGFNGAGEKEYQDWLVEDSSEVDDVDVRDAMRMFIEDKEDFTRIDWVKQVAEAVLVEV